MVSKAKSMFTVTAFAALLAFALLLATMSIGARPADAAAITYTLTDLGTLGGASIARDINDSGQVAGQSQNTSGQNRAILWENGQMTNLGTLGGPTSAARGIDDSGRVVGFSRISSANNQIRAFLWENGQMTNLGTLTGFSSSEAWHINDTGVAVGRSFNSTSQGRAVLWENGQIKDLGASLNTPYSEAWSINNLGQVVGEAGVADQQAAAFLYESRTGAVTDLNASIDPSVFPYPYSEAAGINDAGQIFGWAYRTTTNDPPSNPSGPEGKAFLYQKGAGGTVEVQPLNPLDGDLYSRARDIDESGRVVGWSRGVDGDDAQQFSATLWEDGEVKDLNDLIPARSRWKLDDPNDKSGWKLTDPYAINESGQIAGTGYLYDKDGNKGQLRAFLLTPDTTAPRIECGTADDLWHKEDVSIPCTASDDGVGLADPTDASFTLTTSVLAGTETADARTDSREVCDAAGNCATAGPIAGNKVDKKAPDIAITTSPSGDEFMLGDDVTVSYDCTDGGSGMASCSGPEASGGNLDTALVGRHTFTVEASDEVGNVDSESFVYNVVYDFGGFFRPVDNPDVLNRVQAGSAIPVKFSLGGDQSLDVFAEGYPKSQQIECDSIALVDNIEQTVKTGDSGLYYDASLDQYTYVWKSARAWSGTCRQLVMKLNDGTVHRANFKFR